MKIVQFGLHYSPNVGDGIISETLGHAVRAARPDVEFVTVDMSGRSGFGAETVRNRAQVLAVLGLLPRVLRGRVVEARLGRMLDRVEADWRAALDGADLAILGGGQILSDADLNFCTKIARVADLTRSAGVPVAVHAAGVSANWSARGTRLFSRLFDSDLRAVGLRDAQSIANWQAQTAGRGPVPRLTPDPGLLAAECYGPGDGPGDEIALGITAPQLLRYHSDGAVAGAGQSGVGFFASLAEELAGRGRRVCLFCNGAAEDRAALTRVAGMATVADQIARGRVRVAPPPETPSDLVAIVRACRAVIAHRMHAIIVAYAYQLPVLGLGWDRKVESFLVSVGQQGGFIDAEDASAGHVADRLDSRLAEGIDPDAHAQAVAGAQAAVAGLLSGL